MLPVHHVVLKTWVVNRLTLKIKLTLSCFFPKNSHKRSKICTNLRHKQKTSWLLPDQLSDDSIPPGHEYSSCPITLSSGFGCRRVENLISVMHFSLLTYHMNTILFFIFFKVPSEVAVLSVTCLQWKARLWQNWCVRQEQHWVRTCKVTVLQWR